MWHRVRRWVCARGGRTAWWRLQSPTGCPASHLRPRRQLRQRGRTAWQPARSRPGPRVPPLQRQFRPHLPSSRRRNSRQVRCLPRAQLGCPNPAQSAVPFRTVPGGSRTWSMTGRGSERNTLPPTVTVHPGVLRYGKVLTRAGLNRQRGARQGGPHPDLTR